MLAGISSDYYLRLEQGRNHNPSIQVLESLARVLGLDETATAYLMELAAPTRRMPRRRRATVSAGIRQLIDSIEAPAFVESRHFDVLASNDLARAISPNLRVGENRMRAMFLDPGEQALCKNFELAMAHMVAGFRQSVGTETDDPRFVQIVGELSLASERFRQLWARHDVQAREGSQTSMRHPQVGELMLFKERLTIGAADGLTLVVYQPVAGTGTSERLGLLASLVATGVSEAQKEAIRPGGADPTRP